MSDAQGVPGDDETGHVILTVSDPLPPKEGEVERGVRYAVPSFMPKPASWFLDALERRGRIPRAEPEGEATES